MQDQDYEVVAVSPNPPREWDGPNGKVYYISVRLKGHDKAISIGKKAPDALKVGDTVFGHILVEQSFPEDKFKAGKKPFPAAGGGFSGGASKPTYQPKDEHAIAKAVALKAAVDYVVGTHPKAGKDLDLPAVENAANFFLTWLEAKDGSSESTDPKAQTNPTTSQSASKDNDAEAASLYQSIASNEGLDEFGQPEINPQDIPF